MKLTTEAITTSVQVYPTASAAISGSVAVDMSDFRHAVLKVFAHRLPDANGEGVITASLYENTSTTLAGTEVAASVVTSSLTSASDVILQSEIDVADLQSNDSYRYVYAYVDAPTVSDIAVTIDRDIARNEV